VRHARKVCYLIAIGCDAGVLPCKGWGSRTCLWMSWSASSASCTSKTGKLQAFQGGLLPRSVIAEAEQGITGAVMPRSCAVQAGFDGGVQCLAPAVTPWAAVGCSCAGGLGRLQPSRGSCGRCLCPAHHCSDQSAATVAATPCTSAATAALQRHPCLDAGAVLSAWSAIQTRPVREMRGIDWCHHGHALQSVLMSFTGPV
jgi:hypothetical protein